VPQSYQVAATVLWIGEIMPLPNIWTAYANRRTPAAGVTAFFIIKIAYLPFFAVQFAFGKQFFAHCQSITI
jgi:hypothetical protein